MAKNKVTRVLTAAPLEIHEYLTAMGSQSPNTIDTYKRAIVRLIENLNLKTFDDFRAITPRDGLRHQQMLARDMKASSVNTYMRPINAMFNWFVNYEYLDDNPFSRVKAMDEPQNVQTFLTRKEMREIIDNTKGTEEKLMVLLLLTMGLRRSELVNIKVDDIVGGTHIIINGKGNKQRALAIHDDVVPHLKLWLQIRSIKFAHRDSPYLFISGRGDKYAGNTIRERLKRIMERAGFDEDRIDEIHPHTLRHTFTANLFDADVDFYTAQMLLGHSSPQTTQRYAHLRSHRLDNAIKNQASVFDS